MKRTFLIIGIVFGCILCATNIVLAAVFPNSGANIFTAVSGWVSGISTIILGMIAVVQNRNYKEENDRYLKEQKKLNDLSIQEQKDLEWRKTKYEILQMTLNEYRNRQEEFQLSCDIRTVLTPIVFESDENEMYKNYTALNTNFHNASFKLLFSLEYSPQYFDWYEKLYHMVNDYYEQCIQLFDTIEEEIVGDALITDVLMKQRKKINELDKQFINIRARLPMFQLLIENDISYVFEKDVQVLKLFYKKLEQQKQQWKEKLKKEKEQPD